MATRRKPTAIPPSVNGTISPSTDSTSSTQTMPSPSSRSPFFPTRLETLLMAIYPITLLLGSLISTFSDTTRNAPYDPILQSHPPSHAPSYFAQKKNVFNVYFVKIGWFWTTLALLTFILTNPTLGPPLWPVPTRRRVQAVLRWVMATGIWVLTTQWAFGPPLIDRGFRITGGVCEMLVEAGEPSSRTPLLREGKDILTAAVCKGAGGRWAGGYDISGHVFLLILGSALLWFEILPAVLRSVEGLRDGRTVQLADGRLATAASVKETNKKEDEVKGDQDVTSFGVRAGVGVAALMWWMLLMTAAYFHTWPEKFTGLLVAFAGIWTIYFAPRGIPALRVIVGMPGV